MNSGYNPNNRYTDYSALTDSLHKMRKVLDLLEFSGNIGFPKLGCGLGNGDWESVSRILEQVFHDKRIYVYTLD